MSEDVGIKTENPHYMRHILVVCQCGYSTDDFRDWLNHGQRERMKGEDDIGCE